MNRTLGAPYMYDCGRDPRGVSETSLLSLGDNDWGASPAFSDKGLGGEVDSLQWEIKESAVVAPSDMIMLADSKPGDGSSAKPARGLFDGNIDPTTPAEWPSNRHNRRAVLVFCDGHAEAAIRNDVIGPKNDPWHRRWNDDNSLAGSWTVDPREAAKLDP